MAETKHAPEVDSGIVEMWRRDGRLYAIAGLVVGLALGVIILPAIAALDNAEAVREFFNDLAPEVIGILITYLAIDRIIRKRDERNAADALKRQLVMDAASLSNETAKNAVHQMRRKGWLIGEDELLKGANLVYANLQGAYLNRANLQGANLNRTNLRGATAHQVNLQNSFLTNVNLENAKLSGASLNRADLVGANLRRANLFHADLYGANLFMAHLDSANLQYANLRDASLINADFRGADLYGANMIGAKLETDLFQRTDFDETTTMPDGVPWSPNTDMKRFTDPDHPEFFKVFDWNDEQH